MALPAVVGSSAWIRACVRRTVAAVHEMAVRSRSVFTLVALRVRRPRLLLRRVGIVA